MRGRKGFTLVEILIVVVILGILAAIVIPQFSSASTEAKEASLCSDLQSMRAAIELYKIQHNDEMPTDGGATFSECMTGVTDVAGDVSALNPGDWGAYGPYLQRIPTNPFIADPNTANTVEINGTVGGDTAGWNFNTTTGAFHADDSDTCMDGTAHTAL